MDVESCNVGESSSKELGSVSSSGVGIGRYLCSSKMMDWAVLAASKLSEQDPPTKDSSDTGEFDHNHTTAQSRLEAPKLLWEVLCTFYVMSFCYYLYEIYNKHCGVKGNNLEQFNS